MRTGAVKEKEGLLGTCIRATKRQAQKAKGDPPERVLSKGNQSGGGRKGEGVGASWDVKNQRRKKGEAKV